MLTELLLVVTLAKTYSVSSFIWIQQRSSCPVSKSLGHLIHVLKIPMERININSFISFSKLPRRWVRTFLLNTFAAFSLISFSNANTCSNLSTCSQDQPVSLWKTLHTSEVSYVNLAIFPLGSIENHGPHLPLGTDLLLAEALTTKAASNFSNVTVLPPSPFGASFEHGNWPGTIPVLDRNLNGLWEDVISAIVKSGVRKILLVNAHGGQTPNVEIAARVGRHRYDALVVSVNAQALLTKAWKSVEERKGLLDIEGTYGIHGGLIETAVMMYLFPELVRKESIMHFKPRYTRDGRPLEPHGERVTYGWRSEDLSDTGALGDAASANAQLGEAIFREAIGTLKELITQILETDEQKLLHLTT